MMDENSYAWSAGIWEADGSGGIWTNHGLAPVIKVVMNDIEILKTLKYLFKGSICEDMKGRKAAKGYRYTKPMFKWYVSRRLALNFALKVIPYVKGRKREIIIKIIKYYNKDITSRYQV